MTFDPGAWQGPQPVLLEGGTRPEAVAALLEALRTRLGATTSGEPTAGESDRPTAQGPVLPHAPCTPDAALATPLRRPVPAGTVAIVRTSGSTTGTGHLVALGRDALVASARATEQRLSGPGRWVLAVPAHHVAGLQVLVRSVVAGTQPTVVSTANGFRPADLADAVGNLPDDLPGYLSLVPTQLVRVLDHPDAVEALRRLAAILVGGAHTRPEVLERARDAGLRVVTTYGMTETGGGCVYDGVPLEGVRVRIGADERVEISGPVLASGYLDDDEADAATFVTEDGTRWLRTSDRGRIERTPDGGERLTVLGRADDVIITGGVKVSPAAVEQALGVEAAVVGVPDDEWGQLVTAVVAAPPGTTTLEAIRNRVTDRLGGAHAPRALVVVDALPLRGPGKVDRIAVARLAVDALAGPARPGVERHS